MKLKDVYTWLRVWTVSFTLTGAEAMFVRKYCELVSDVGKKIAEENSVEQQDIDQLDGEIELGEGALQAFVELEDYLESNGVAMRRKS